MAFVTQFDVDQQRLAKQDQAVEGLGDAIVSGVNRFEENRRRALDEKRGKAGDIAKMRTSGFNVDEKKYDDYVSGNGGIENLFSERTPEYERNLKLKEQEAENRRQDRLLSREHKAVQADLARAQLNDLNKDYADSREGKKTKAKAEMEFNLQNSPERIQAEARNKQYAELSTKNSNLANVRNGMDAALKQLEDKNLSEEDKIKTGQGLLKLLNSAEGADAVGAEEAKRIGSYLEYKVGNFTQPGSFIGRDLDKFTDQVRNNSQLLGQRIQSNQQSAEGLLRGQNLGAPQVQAPQVHPVIQQRVNSYTPEQAEARRQELLRKAGAR